MYSKTINTYKEKWHFHSNYPAIEQLILACCCKSLVGVKKELQSGDTEPCEKQTVSRHQTCGYNDKSLPEYVRN